jgi:Uncharacterized protein with SCP/PR1 domains
MIKKRIRVIGVFLLILTCFTFTSPAAFAAWESGIKVVTPPSDAQKPETLTHEAYEAEVIRLINIERTSRGLSALQSSEQISTIADLRARESSELFSHTRPSGSICATALTENGLDYLAFGENLAYGYKNPTDLVAGWMNSPSHMQNILSNDFAYTGVGYFTDKNGRLYCAQLFYTPQN